MIVLEGISLPQVMSLLLIALTSQHRAVVAVVGQRQRRALTADPTICSLSAGTIDPSSGECEICVNAANCECVIDTNSFDVDCSNFCVDSYCGAVSCSSGIEGASCEGTVASDVGTTDDNIALSITCDVSRHCTCSATYRGGACAVCDGAAEGFDCGNVDDGPCVAAGSCEDATRTTSEPTPAPARLPRSYRTDASFLGEVERMSLPAASDLAGVPIGAAVPDDAGGRNAAWSLEAQKKWVPSVYNMIVVENGMKWPNLLEDPDVLGTYDFSNADAILDHAVGVGAKVRGHVLIWGRGRGKTYPEAFAVQVEQSDNPEDTLKELMAEHIRSVVTHFNGKVDVWDVVNEHLSSQIPDNIFYTTLGDDYVRFAFETASTYLPDNNTRLVWNEALSDFRLDNPTIAWWLETLRTYKRESVPIDGIGVQGHNINQKHNVSDLAVFLREVADMGYDVELTEIDAPIGIFSDDEAGDDDDDDPFKAQGDFFGRYATACLDAGRCKGITFWGLDDNHTWYDGLFTETSPNLPLLIDEEGYMKPAWLGVRQAFESYANSPTISPVDMSAAWHRIPVFHHSHKALVIICWTTLYYLS